MLRLHFPDDPNPRAHPSRLLLLGIEAVRSFRENFAPLLEVTWVDAPLHDAGLDLLLHRGKRRLSLVDAVSFVAMRQNGISEALAFDPHFEQEGYVLID